MEWLYHTQQGRKRLKPLERVRENRRHRTHRQRQVPSTMGTSTAARCGAGSGADELNSEGNDILNSLFSPAILPLFQPSPSHVSSNGTPHAQLSTAAHPITVRSSEFLILPNPVQPSDAFKNLLAQWTTTGPRPHFTKRVFS